MDKNADTPQGSEDDDDGSDVAQRAFLNLGIVNGDWTTNVEPPPFCPLMTQRQACNTIMLAGAIFATLFWTNSP
ncbi:hypothetical protein KIN20_022436 [Parelaphostrongylus tenuis]|uniref:Uncharacterized protein n=1 Tax=Parelaphostrongylus tenuis TaxID=148309 RepID=A0AAD5N8Z8_PARTN|nr:hypothetical protein KIN20_022436 [Parelaphostrongylus tenuis]